MAKVLNSQQQQRRQASSVKSLSTFHYFQIEERPKIETAFPNKTSEEIDKEITIRWVESNLETKRKYILQACSIKYQQDHFLPEADQKLQRTLPILKFYNCLILRDHKLLDDEFWTYGSIIINPEPHFFNEKVTPDFVFDCKGAIIAPGFIDVQLNGGFGVDFSFDIDSVEIGLDKVAKGILAHGVTSFCPTLVSSFPNVYEKVLPCLRPRAGGINGAQVLGAHIEGPFISKEKKGAHDPDTLVEGFDKGIESLVEVYKCLDAVALITIAPELKNSAIVIKELDQMGIVVSIGHSVATIAEGEEAVCHGASFITHLFNAMLPFHHRDPGLVGLLGSNKIPAGKTIFYGLIADGNHTHPATTRIAYRSYPQGVVLVTDACSAMGLTDGNYRLGQQTIQVQGTKAYIKGTNTLAGSVATMISCIQHFWKVTSCSLVEALEACTLHPARLMKIADHKGTLDFGTDADFVLLTSDKLTVESTWIAGECVYNRSKDSKLS